MAFGEDEIEESYSPDTIATRSPCSTESRRVSLAENSPCKSPVVKHSPIDLPGSAKRNGKKRSPKSEQMEEDMAEDDDQEFVDHEAMCRRLERRLGLRYYPQRQEDAADEWKELASVVGSRYISAAHLYPAFAATVARQNVSPSALLLCLIYIDRLHDAHPSVNFDGSLNSADLFVVSLMSACKFLYDVGEVGDCYNGTWARDFNIPIKTLNRLEFTFLDALQWNLHADQHDFDAMLHDVEAEITEFGCQFRDCLTYSDLLVLSDPRTGFSMQFLCDFIAYVTKMLAALTATYILLGCVALTATTLAPLMVQMTHRPLSTTCPSPCSATPFPSPHWIVSWMNLTRLDAAAVCRTLEDDVILPVVNLDKPRPGGTSLRLAAWKKLGRGSWGMRGRVVMSVA